MSFSEFKDILAIPSAVIALTGLSLSLWTAYQVGRLDFERRRQTALGSMNAFEISRASRANELSLLIDRLNSLQSNPEAQGIIIRITEMREKLAATKKAIENLDCGLQSKYQKTEVMQATLSNRVLLECVIGSYERLVAEATSNGWNKEFESYSEEVKRLEAIIQHGNG